MGSGHPSLHLNEPEILSLVNSRGNVLTEEHRLVYFGAYADWRIPQGFLNQAVEELKASHHVAKLYQHEDGLIEITLTGTDLYISEADLRRITCVTIGTIKQLLKGSQSRSEGRKEPGVRQYVNRT